MNRPTIVIKLTEKQNKQMRDLADKEFVFDPRKFTINGLLIGQPDINIGKMEIGVLMMWEARIMIFVLSILNILRGFRGKDKKHLTEDGYFTLRDEK